MSRIAKYPITIPAGVNITVVNDLLSVNGKKGTYHFSLDRLVAIHIEGNELRVSARDESVAADALAGTTRATVNNGVLGVTQGFEKKLLLVGVGYRANVQGKSLNLTLGFSHPVAYPIPEGIIIETPIPTEIVIKGIDKQLVGQVAAEIRAYRPPEVYKGKGVRYSTEKIKLKETKKK